MDIILFLTIIGTAVTTIFAIHGFLRNFKADINGHIDRLEKRMDKFDARMETMEERIFWIATGKRLEDAILEEKLKRQRTDP